MTPAPDGEPPTARARLETLRIAGAPLPPLAELASAAIALADGTAGKALLAVTGEPLEYALCRRDDDAVVSVYEAGAVPEPLGPDVVVALPDLLAGCAAALREPDGAEGAAQEARERLADRVAGTRVQPPTRPAPGPTRVHGGDADDADAPLTFAFDVTITPCPGEGPYGDRADAHALLFPGVVHAGLRGRRGPLVDGPVMPVVLRLVGLARSLLEAWEAERSVHVRVRAGEWLAGCRRERDGRVTFTLGPGTAAPLTATDLDVPDVARPILRLASDLIRGLVSVDRRQSRNLRVRALRRELRALRRRVRRRAERTSFVNTDPDRLRASSPPPPLAAPAAEAPPARGSLRYSERWRVELEALDASATFAAGEHLVVASPQQTVALGRDAGALAWVREGLGGATAMAGRTLVRLAPDGRVELCSVEDGEPYATTRIHGLAGQPAPRPLHVRAPDVPETLLLPVGPRLLAFDLRTAEPRWRASFGEGPLVVRRAGRVVVVRCGEGAVHALDAATGEVVWRHAAPRPAVAGPLVDRDRVWSASRGEVTALDLYSGRVVARRSVGPEVRGLPLAAAGTAVAVVVAEGGARSRLVGVRVDVEGVAFEADDPGLGAGASALDVDGALVVNTPTARLVGLAPDGTTRWDRSIGDPHLDELPRRLEPVLRGGALFVPGAGVHVVRPADGAPLGDPLPTDLVPDLLRVDERGWVYVGEESGTLAAYAPVPHLRLVR